MAMDDYRKSIDPTTEDGWYSRVLEKTGSVEQAEKARIEFRIQAKMASLPQSGMIVKEK